MTSEPLKLIGLLDRRPDLSLAQFAQHWRTTHRDLALRLIAPGFMEGYVQNHRLADGGEMPGLPVAADGLPELWTSGADLLERLGSAPAYLEGAYLDEPNFMDGRSRTLLARETVIEEGPGRIAAAALVKAMIFVRRRKGMSSEAFAEAWLRDPSPVLMPGARPVRLVRHVSIELPGRVSAAYEDVQCYDGVEASYWPDVAAFQTAWAARAAAPEQIDPDSIAGVLVREEPVLFPRHG